MANIGFTGTRKGLNELQIRALEALLPQYHQHGFDRIVHGACEGADQDVHRIFRRLFTYHMWPSNEEQHAWALNNVHEGDRVERVWPPLVRNHLIVDASGFLVAAPSGTEVMRSGTWATVRYARLVRKNRYIVKPDGCIDVEFE